IPTVRQADHCIACRKCEKECPQNIRIPDQLRRIDRYIESLKRETIE
ncbi:MAG: 4Fe-4S binding protein, partial [Bacteroidales bacterium]|nr:4Fe-4S binding protein [Bacteroidales bacterium]